MSQLLRENDISLHVLTDDSFNVRRVFGYDRYKAFVRKDQGKLVGDENLKKEIVPTKSLGQCAILALDTDGSIFSSKLLTSVKKNENDLRIFGNIFAKRIAQNAKQKPCYMCECEGLNSGSAFLSCNSCKEEINSVRIMFLFE